MVQRSIVSTAKGLPDALAVAECHLRHNELTDVTIITPRAGFSNRHTLSLTKSEKNRRGIPLVGGCLGPNKPGLRSVLASIDRDAPTRRSLGRDLRC